MQRHLPITAEAFNIPVDIIPPSTLNDKFKKAEELLNKDASITKAASSEPNTRNVKSSNDPKPHFLQPRGKNKFYVECDCRLFHWYKICQNALAAGVDIGISFEYLTEVKKKMLQGKGSLTDAVNTMRKLSRKEMKKNEVKKAAKKSKTKSVIKLLHKNQNVTKGS